MKEEKKNHSEKEKQNKEDKNKKQDEVKKLKSKIKKLESKVRHLKEENSELKEANENYKTEYLRKAADMENMRKRIEKEKSDYFNYALCDVLKDVLSILDNFERALESEQESNLREGIELIYKQLKDFLRKQGVVPVEMEEKKFNPNIHQAFMTEESGNVDEPQIAQVLQKGYKMNDRLLRPAMVKVIVPKKGSENGSNNRD